MATDPDPEIARRIARFSETMRSRDLWTDIPEARLSAARREIETVIRRTLAGARPGAAEPATFGDDAEGDARTVSVAAFSIGVGPLLGHWIGEGRLRAPASLRTLLVEQLEQNRAFAERMERELLPTLDALLQSGITPLVMKGFHIARAYWADVGIRPAADVDLVVHPNEVDRAEVVLLDHGFRPTSPRTTRPYARHWSPAGEQLVYSVERPDARNPWRIDLHDSLDRDLGPGLCSDFDAERDRVQSFVVAARTLWAPDPSLTLLLLASQIAREINSMRLMRLLDIIEVVRARRGHGTLDWDATLAMLRRTNSARLMFPAFVLAEDLAPGTVDRAVLAECSRASSWLLRRLVRRLVPSGSAPHRESAQSIVMWATGPRMLLRRLMWRLWPAGARRTTRVRRVLQRIRSGGLGMLPHD